MNLCVFYEITKVYENVICYFNFDKKAIINKYKKYEQQQQTNTEHPTHTQTDSSRAIKI